jgi:hypothetical protein
MALFRGPANRSSTGLAPHVEHRSPTVKRMDHVHVWVSATNHCASAATDEHCTSDHIGSHGYGYTA